MGVKIRPRFNRNGKKLDKDEKARVSIGVYWDSKKRKFLATDYFVTEEQWDAKKLIVNNHHENFQYINAKIKELGSKLETSKLATPLLWQKEMGTFMRWSTSF